MSEEERQKVSDLLKREPIEIGDCCDEFIPMTTAEWALVRKVYKDAITQASWANYD